jgi:SnoaL-like domain
MKGAAMTTFDTLAERYIDLWNETDPAARRRGVDEFWSDNARYVDPMVDAQGREAIDQTIAAVQEQFPGFAVRLAGPVDAHHNQGRFTWELGPAGDEAPIVGFGFDVAVTDADGRFQTVLGFLDKVPTA